MTQPEEHNKLPVTDHKEMGIQELPNKEFRTSDLKMLRELKENTDKPKLTQVYCKLKKPM